MAKTKTTFRKSNKAPFYQRGLLSHVKRPTLFLLAFAAIGTYVLFRVNASPTLTVKSNSIAAGYVNSKPITMSRDPATGKTTYQSYPASYLVLADGTLLCDDGNSAGTVETGTVSTSDVKKLQGDLAKLEINKLPKHIAATTSDTQISTYEGYLAVNQGEISAVTLDKKATKPNKLTKMQSKILAYCDRATIKQKRGQTKKFEISALPAPNQTALNKITTTLAPKAAAAGQYPVTENRVAADDIYNWINNFRASKGLRKLTRLSCYDTLAFAWAKKMATQGYISHNPNLGSQVGTSYCTNYANWTKLGENVGKTTSSNLVNLKQAFLDSPAHYANIVDPAWNYIGVGGYNNNTTELSRGIYVTQNFMKY
jgi:uncharacterized protein YkwD